MMIKVVYKRGSEWISFATVYDETADVVVELS